MPYTPHVLVIGGGVLGTAIARDLAIRGFETTLLEQGTLTGGATGRMQGVLYSGARFAATDPSGAKRCRRESDVLRQIAAEYVRETGGVIAAPPGEEDELDELIGAAQNCDIGAEAVSGEELHEMTDGLAQDVSRGVRVGDAAIDPFRLTVATARSAESYGADVQTGAAVSELRFEGGRVAGATVAYDDPTAARPQPGDRSGIEPPGADLDAEDQRAPDSQTEAEDQADEEGEETAPEPVAEIQRAFPGASDDDEPGSGATEEIEADFVVNATGAWADRIAAMAGIDLALDRVRGTMAVLDGELSETILTQWGDSDSRRWLTPFWGNTVLGAVAEPFADAGSTADAVDRLLDEPPTALAVDEPAVLRGYTGLWTTHPGAKSAPQGPGATIIDHRRHHDRWGMMTVLGGTVTTHRAVAKTVVDQICREFGVSRACRTAEIPLPSVDSSDEESNDGAFGAVSRAKQAMSSVTNRGTGADPVLCEARGVRRSAVQKALDEDTSLGTDLTEVRTRTGATMGDCQGGRCGHRLAAQLYPDSDAETVEQALAAFMQRRWAGRRQALWGDQLSAAMADYELHTRGLGRDLPTPEEFDRFDDGPEDDEDRRRPTCCEAVMP